MRAAPAGARGAQGPKLWCREGQVDREREQEEDSDQHVLMVETGLLVWAGLGKVYIQLAACTRRLSARERTDLVGQKIYIGISQSLI